MTLDKPDMSNFRVIVLLAVDDTEYSEYAFIWYRDFVHRPENFLVLLHCTEHDNQELRDAKVKPKKASLVPTGWKSGPGRTKTMIVELTERMRFIEDKFGQLMQRSGISGRIQRGGGKPGEAIIKAAVEEGASMIVTGTRGLGKIKRTFLGSVSDYVAHHSPVPVIICRKTCKSSE